MSITLRAAEPRDHPVLTALRMDAEVQHMLLAYPPPEGDRDVAGWIDRREAAGRLWTIDEQSICRGFVQLADIHGKGRFAWLGIALDADACGRGIGEQAMLALEREAVAMGLRKLLLEVRADNRGAIGLYERLGYRHVGRLKDHYDDGTRRRDTLIMEKLLAAA